MAIGGYNQLPLTNLNTVLHAEAYCFQSARAALYAYLNETKVKVIYLPNYICDSIIPAIKSLHIQIEFYEINAKLEPEININNLDKSNSKILIINYFGLLDEKINKMTALEAELFIIDNSQALFCEHIEGTTSIYSPRKFLGIPDGGYLFTSKNIAMPTEYFDASKNSGHLLLRAAGFVQEGYTRFLEAEQALDSFAPKKMSVISEYIIKCTDIKSIKEKRRSNYKVLNNMFKSQNQLQVSLTQKVPLCYPLKLNFDVDNLCRELISNGIYLPRYWRSEYSGETGKNMFNKTLFLPVDERLRGCDMDTLIDAIEQKISSDHSRCLR